ncbi:hypothetical protein SBOR_7332 [Sclerotinia borealis F-4128]|uniref:N-acetyltransferase domain-containing protein n=1 Tax=Sclerotinia borealis (strain F-4128) TaxID=1432307 RepID=W9C6C1_SCLBF|nr:hypothetical protein SBOR_7332 [Sclerotinia borealis F-4128]
MSSHAASGNNNYEDPMNVDEESVSTSSDISEEQLNEGDVSATILRDSADSLTRFRSLRESDVLVLLTPVVTPVSQEVTDTSDPFECLGRSLAKRHKKVRHIPYTQRNGITSTHLGFIKRSHVIILCFVDRPGHQLQLEFAEILFAVSDHKPCLIMICGDQTIMQDSIPFPTVILTSGYTAEEMEAAAAVIFGERQPNPKVGLTSSAPGRTEPIRPKLWAVDEWDETKDVSSFLKLWTDNFDVRFSIDLEAFASLLRRIGYAKHYVVRDPRGGEVLGFCATYLSYVDQEGERLIASLAILVVEKTSRRQGIGLSLHNHAMRQFRSTRGVIRLQLGSTFPRLLYGPLRSPSPDLTENDEWFRRRGWTLNKESQGQGQSVYDLILDFTKWTYRPSQQQEGFKYRQSVQEDMDKVLRLVEDASIKQGNMGWFDQYFALSNGPNVKDIVLCLEGDQIIAMALTYTPSCGSSISSNLPWAGRIGHDVGGVTCLCVSPQIKEPIGPELLNACVQKLYQQGMRRMFFDGVANGVDELKQLGFEEWANYRDRLPPGKGIFHNEDLADSDYWVMGEGSDKLQYPGTVYFNDQSEFITADKNLSIHTTTEAGQQHDRKQNNAYIHSIKSHISHGGLVGLQLGPSTCCNMVKVVTRISSRSLRQNTGHAASVLVIFDLKLRPHERGHLNVVQEPGTQQCDGVTTPCLRDTPAIAAVQTRICWTSSAVSTAA